MSNTARIPTKPKSSDTLGSSGPSTPNTQRNPSFRVSVHQPTTATTAIAGENAEPRGGIANNSVEKASNKSPPSEPALDAAFGRVESSGVFSHQQSAVAPSASVAPAPPTTTTATTTQQRRRGLTTTVQVNRPMTAGGTANTNLLSAHTHDGPPSALQRRGSLMMGGGGGGGFSSSGGATSTSTNRLASFRRLSTGGGGGKGSSNVSFLGASSPSSNRLQARSSNNISNLESVPGAVLYAVRPMTPKEDPTIPDYIKAKHCEFLIQNTPTISCTQTQTEFIPLRSTGQQHKEGGWPSSIDSLMLSNESSFEEESGKYLKRVLREDKYGVQLESCVKRIMSSMRCNAAIEIYSMAFDDQDHHHGNYHSADGEDDLHSAAAGRGRGESAEGGGGGGATNKDTNNNKRGLSQQARMSAPRDPAQEALQRVMDSYISLPRYLGMTTSSMFDVPPPFADSVVSSIAWCPGVAQIAVIAFQQQQQQHQLLQVPVGEKHFTPLALVVDVDASKRELQQTGGGSGVGGGGGGGGVSSSAAGGANKGSNKLSGSSGGGPTSSSSPSPGAGGGSGGSTTTATPFSSSSSSQTLLCGPVEAGAVTNITFGLKNGNAYIIGGTSTGGVLMWDFRDRAVNELSRLKQEARAKEKSAAMLMAAAAAAAAGGSDDASDRSGSRGGGGMTMTMSDHQQQQQLLHFAVGGSGGGGGTLSQSFSSASSPAAATFSGPRLGMSTIADRLVATTRGLGGGDHASHGSHHSSPSHHHQQQLQKQNAELQAAREALDRASDLWIAPWCHALPPHVPAHRTAVVTVRAVPTRASHEEFVSVGADGCVFQWDSRYVAAGPVGTFPISAVMPDVNVFASMVAAHRKSARFGGGGGGAADASVSSSLRAERTAAFVQSQDQRGDDDDEHVDDDDNNNNDAFRNQHHHHRHHSAGISGVPFLDDDEHADDEDDDNADDYDQIAVEREVFPAGVEYEPSIGGATRVVVADYEGTVRVVSRLAPTNTTTQQQQQQNSGGIMHLGSMSSSSALPLLPSLRSSSALLPTASTAADVLAASTTSGQGATTSMLTPRAGDVSPMSASVGAGVLTPLASNAASAAAQLQQQAQQQQHQQQQQQQQQQNVGSIELTSTLEAVQYGPLRTICRNPHVPKFCAAHSSVESASGFCILAEEARVLMRVGFGGVPSFDRITPVVIAPPPPPPPASTSASAAVPFSSLAASQRPTHHPHHPTKNMFASSAAATAATAAAAAATAATKGSNGITTLAWHPLRPALLLAGTANGAVIAWDLCRSFTDPAWTLKLFPKNASVDCINVHGQGDVAFVSATLEVGSSMGNNNMNSASADGGVQQQQAANPLSNNASLVFPALDASGRPTGDVTPQNVSMATASCGVDGGGGGGTITSGASSPQVTNHSIASSPRQQQVNPFAPTMMTMMMGNCINGSASPTPTTTTTTTGASNKKGLVAMLTFPNMEEMLVEALAPNTFAASGVYAPQITSRRRADLQAERTVLVSILDHNLHVAKAKLQQSSAAASAAGSGAASVGGGGGPSSFVGSPFGSMRAMSHLHHQQQQQQQQNSNQKKRNKIPSFVLDSGAAGGTPDRNRRNSDEYQHNNSNHQEDPPCIVVATPGVARMGAQPSEVVFGAREHAEEFLALVGKT